MDENKRKKEAANGPLLKKSSLDYYNHTTRKSIRSCQPIKQDDPQVIAMNDTKITIVLS